jgi:hypothetical protein
MNAAQTLSVDLNVLAEQAPKIPPAFTDSRHVFLANTHPQLQLAFAESLKHKRLVVADTMNLWIETTRADLLALLKKVDGLVLNDGEARLLTGERNMISAARAVLKMGPKFVVIKKGEHGSLAADRRPDPRAARFSRRRCRRPDRRRRQLRGRHDGATSRRTARSTRRSSAAQWPTAR